MGGDPVTTVESRVREQIRRRGVDPVRDADEVRKLVAEVLEEWDREALAGTVKPVGDRADAARTVLSNVAGLGPLQQYLDDPEIEEIWINRPSQVFVARGGVSELTPTILTESQVRDLVEHMLKLSGRRLDLSSPFVDASLPGGERLHAVIPDVTREHWSVNIRKYVARAQTVRDLVELGTLTEQAARFLDAAVVCGLNVLVAGGTQAGKTTTLGALAGSIPARERIITCEEVFELRLAHRDVVGLQCRQPSLEGTGEIDLRRLVKEALRMRPSRIIIGEVREAESLDMLIAPLCATHITPLLCTLSARRIVSHALRYRRTRDSATSGETATVVARAAGLPGYVRQRRANSTCANSCHGPVSRPATVPCRFRPSAAVCQVDAALADVTRARRRIALAPARGCEDAVA